MVLVRETALAMTSATTPGDHGPRLAIVGAGRMGSALCNALGDAAGPFGHGFDGDGYDAVILAVPDDQIATAAAVIAPGRLVGHCAGAIGLHVLAPHEAFGIHPLMTVTDSQPVLAGAGGAIAGTTPRALGYARALAERLGLEWFEVADDQRPLYHAAASVAANFLVTVEDAAEELLALIGADRRILVPLVRAALENWAVGGGRRAITGPIARGDEATVALQRAAIAERAPEYLPMFDALAERTRALVARPGGSGSGT